MEEEKKNKTITILDKDYVQWVQELSKRQRVFITAIFIIASNIIYLIINHLNLRLNLGHIQRSQKREIV